MWTWVYKPWNNPHEYYSYINVISTINHSFFQPLINQYIYHKPSFFSATNVHQRFTLSLDWGPHPVVLWVSQRAMMAAAEVSPGPRRWKLRGLGHLHHAGALRWGKWNWLDSFRDISWYFNFDSYETLSHWDFFWLVGGDWNMAGLWLSIYWEFHHPNWRAHIFQRVETTNQLGLEWDFHGTLMGW